MVLHVAIAPLLSVLFGLLILIFPRALNYLGPSISSFPVLLALALWPSGSAIFWSITVFSWRVRQAASPSLQSFDAIHRNGPAQ